jgi:hypothetical protein
MVAPAACGRLKAELQHEPLSIVAKTNTPCFRQEARRVRFWLERLEKAGGGMRLVLLLVRLTVTGS